MRPIPPLSISPSNKYKTHLYGLVVVISLIILATLYIRTIKLDLPYHYHVDEEYFYLSAIQIRQTGLQPNVLYPPLSPYLTSLISVVMDATSGSQPILGDVTNAAPIYLAGRLLSALATLVACCFMYQIGKRLHSPVAGLVLLWLFGSDPQVFMFSYQMRGDPFAYLFMAGSLFFALLALDNPKANRAFWLSLGFMLLAILGKYSVAPVAIFPAYLVLQRLIPRVKGQILFVLFGLAVVIVGVIGLRTWGQSLRRTFESAGFLFLFTDQPFNPVNFQSSFGQLQEFFPSFLLVTVAFVSLAAVLSKWKVFSKTQRLAYVLLMLMLVPLLPLMSMLQMRYRDLFVVPFGLYILWTLSAGFLTEWLRGGQRSLLFAIIGLLIAAPSYLADFNQSNFLRVGDSRVLASQWLQTHVHQPTKIVKEYTVGDFLPHVNGYQGGYLGWTVTPSILEKSASDWWQLGNVYAIADTRGTLASWTGTEAAKSRYNGFTLAYQTPLDYLGPGPKIAIFYTFEINTTDQARLGDLAEVFGYNIDSQRVCTQAVLPMRIFLRALHTTDVFYQTEISFRDLSTGLIAYSDRQTPALGNQPTTVWGQYDLIFDDHWITLPPELRAGKYQLEVALFEPFHKDRLAAWDKDGQPIGETVPVGQLEISDCHAGADALVASVSGTRANPDG